MAANTASKWKPAWQATSAPVRDFKTAWGEIEKACQDPEVLDLGPLTDLQVHRVLAASLLESKGPDHHQGGYFGRSGNESAAEVAALRRQVEADRRLPAQELITSTAMQVKEDGGERLITLTWGRPCIDHGAGFASLMWLTSMSRRLAIGTQLSRAAAL